MPLKIDKDLLMWKWWYNPLMMKAFMAMILAANETCVCWRNIQIQRGSFVTSALKLAALINCNEKTIYKILDRLKSSGDITVQTKQRQYTIITITNYEKYSSGGETAVKTDVQPKPKNERKNDKMEECKTTTINGERFIGTNDIERYFNEEGGQIWKEQITLNVKLNSTDDLKEYFKRFQSEMIMRGVERKSEKDLKTHFLNWLRKIIEIDKNGKTGDNKDGNREGGKRVNSGRANFAKFANIGNKPKQHTDLRILAKLAANNIETERKLLNREE